MSEKTCSHHKGRWRKRTRRACACLLILSFILLLIVLIVWAILQPRKPRFVIQDATVYAFNVTSVPNLLTSNIQVTIISRNSNERIGIYYDRLHVYATYRSQQITYYTALPAVYQGHKDTNVWSPFVYGTNVPVAPYNGVALSQDQASGSISLVIKIDGRVRWKVGSVTTGRYRMHIVCPVYIPFGNGNSNTGVVIGNAVKYQLSTRCGVSV